MLRGPTWKKNSKAGKRKIGKKKHGTPACLLWLPGSDERQVVAWLGWGSEAHSNEGAFIADKKKEHYWAEKLNVGKLQQYWYAHPDFFNSSARAGWTERTYGEKSWGHRPFWELKKKNRFFLNTKTRMLFGQHFDGEAPRNLNHVFLRPFESDHAKTVGCSCDESKKRKRKEKNLRMHWPGIEPGPPAWQARILPLNHQCLHVQCSTRGKTDRQRPATNVEVFVTGHQDRTCAAGAPLETDIDQGPILASIGGGRRGGRGGRRRRIGDGTQPPNIRRRSSMSSPISVIKRRNNGKTKTTWRRPEFPGWNVVLTIQLLAGKRRKLWLVWTSTILQKKRKRWPHEAWWWMTCFFLSFFFFWM